ncbi:MAG: hypothetical protein VW443_00440 [Pseudomonadales bacterium]
MSEYDPFASIVQEVRARRESQEEGQYDPLDYASGLSKKEAVEILNDPRFLQDVVDFYYERDGIEFEGPEQAVEYFWDDRSFRNLNTLGIGADVYSTVSGDASSDEQKVRLSRLQTVYDSHPDFWQEGGTGWSGFRRAAKNVLLDPVNLIGFGSGAVAGRAAAKGAMLQGRTVAEAKKAALRQGAKVGAMGEAAAGGGVEAIANTMTQARNIEIGAQDEFSLGQLGMATAGGAVIGGGLGAGMGALGARLPYRQGLTKSSADLGIEDADKITEELTFRAREAETAVDEEGLPQDEETIRLQEERMFRDQEDDQYLKELEEQHLAYLMDELETDSPQVALETVRSQTNSGVERPQSAINVANIQNIREWSTAREVEVKKREKAIAEGNLDAAEKAGTKIASIDAAKAKLLSVLRKSGTGEEVDQAVAGLNVALRSADDAPAPDAGEAQTRAPNAEQTTQATQEGQPVADEGAPAVSPTARPVGEEAPPPPDDAADAEAAKAADDAVAEDVVAEPTLDEQLDAANAELNVLGKERKKIDDRIRYLDRRIASGKGTEEELAEANALPEQKSAKVEEVKNKRAEIKGLNDKKKEEALNVSVGTKVEEAPEQTVVDSQGQTADAEAGPDVSGDQGAGLPAAKGAQGAKKKAESQIVAWRERASNDLAEMDRLATENHKGSIAGVAKFLQENFGIDPASVRKSLAPLRKNKVKSAQNRVTREFIVDTLFDDYADSSIQDIIEFLYEAGHVDLSLNPGVFEPLLGQRLAGAPEELLTKARQKYEQYLDNEFPSVLGEYIAHFADVDEGEKAFVAKFGQDALNRVKRTSEQQAESKQAKDGLSSWLKSQSISDKERERQLKMHALRVEELVKRGYSARTARNISELAAKSDVMKTMRGEGGYRPTYGAQEGRTLVPRYQKIVGRRNSLRDRQARGEDLSEESSPLENVDTLEDELNFLESELNKIERGELSGATPVAGRIQSILRSSNQFGYTGQLFPSSVFRTEDNLRARVSGQEAARRETENAWLDVQTESTIAKEAAIIEERRTGYSRKIQALKIRLDALRKADTSDPVIAKEIKAIKKEINETDKAEIADAIAKDQERIEAIEKGADVGGGMTVKDLKIRIAENEEKSKKTFFQRERAERRVRKNEKAVKDFSNSVEFLKLQQLAAKRFNMRSAKQKQQNAAAQRKIVTKLRQDFGARFEAVMERAKMSYLSGAELHVRNQQAKGKPVDSLDEYERIFHEIWGNDAIDSPLARAQSIESARIVADDRHQRLADASKKGDEIAFALERFKQDGDKAALTKAIYAIVEKVSVTPDNARPVGKNKPLIVVAQSKNGSVEIDVNNAFKFKTTYNDAKEPIYSDVFLNGKNVGRIQPSQTPDGKKIYLLSVKGQSDVLAIANKEDALKRLAQNIPAELERGVQTGSLSRANVKDNLSYIEEDWAQSNTYREAQIEQIDADSGPSDGPDFEADSIDPTSTDELGLDVPLKSIAVPKGRVLGIQILSGKSAGRFRYPSQKQIDNGNTIRDILGKSEDAEFVWGSAKDGLKTSARDDTFVPFKADDNYIPATDVRSAKKSPRGADSVRRNASEEEEINGKRPMSIDKLSSVEVTEEALRSLPSFRSLDPNISIQFKTALDIHNWVMDLETTNWAKFKGKDASELFTNHMAKLEAGYEALAKFAPNGVAYPNATRRKAMMRIGDIFSGRDAGEMIFAMDALRRISGTESRALPNIYKHDPAGIRQESRQSASFRVPRGQQYGNQVTLDGDSQMPMAVDMLHELGHWGYLNILTPQERLQFWGAMKKYVGKNGPNFDALESRLPGAWNNELESPAEFFASQFSQWYVGRSASKENAFAELKTIWSRMAKSLTNVVKRFVLGHKEDIVDPDLRVLFERIAPDSEVGEGAVLKNKFEDVYRAYAFRTRTRSEGQQTKPENYNELAIELSANWLYSSEEWRMKLNEALERNDPGYLEDTLNRAGAYLRNAISPNRHGLLWDFGRSYESVNPKTGKIESKSSDSGSYSYQARQAVKGWLEYKAGMEAGESPLTLSIRNDNELGGISLANAMSDMSVDEQHAMMLRFHATNILNHFANTQRYVAHVFERNFPRHAGLGLKIAPSGKVVSVTFNPQHTKWRAINKDNKIAALNRLFDEDLIAAAAKAEKEVNISDYMNDLPSLDAVNTRPDTASLKDMSDQELLAEMKGGNKRTKRYRNLETELLSREIARQSGEAPRTTTPRTKEWVDEHDRLMKLSPDTLRKRLRDVIDQGGNYDVVRFVLVKKTGVALNPQSSVVGRALTIEMEQSVGTQQYDGIPADAPAGIQEALSKITHRDKTVERNARLLGYRLLNLMGRVGHNLIDETGFMSVGDVYRMAGKKVPDETKGAFATVAKTEGAEFNAARKKLRKFAIGLKEGEGDTFTLMHEIGHLVSVGTFTRSDWEVLEKSFVEALDRGEKLAVAVRNRWQGEFSIPDLAAEWWSENFTMYLGERELKGDLFAYRYQDSNQPLQFKSRLDRMLDRIREFVAYMLNGLIGRQTMKQQFRQLTLYGNMFNNVQKWSPANRAVRSTETPTHVFPSMGKDYVADTINRMDPARQALARQFVMATEDEPLKDFVWFHGTPDGLRSRSVADEFEIADSGSEYGPGVYVIKSRDASDWFSRTSSAEEMGRMIEDSSASAGARARARDLVPEIVSTRESIDQISAEIRGTRWREATQEQADDIMIQGGIDPSSDLPAHRLAVLQEKLIRQTMIEDMLWRELGKELGTNRSPKVMPALVRASDTFNFDSGTEYSIVSDAANDIEWFISSLVGSGLIRNEALRKMALTMGDTFTGTDLYSHLVNKAMIQDGPFRSADDAKQALADHLVDMGYDSIYVTRPWGEHEASEGLVILNTKHIRPLDMGESMDEVGDVLQSTVGRPTKFGGALANAAMLEGDDIFDPKASAAWATELQHAGMPQALQAPIKKILRKEPLKEEDIIAFRKRGGAFNFLKEQSVRLRQMGAHWLSDIMKPEDGPGFYEQQASDMSGSLFNIVEAIRDLPDSKGMLKRWMRKNAGLAFKDIPQPESHIRIISAIRRGDQAINQLDDQEKSIALMLVEAFQREFDEMVELGIPVGDVTNRLGGGRYVPQVWDIEHIRDNPNEFVNLIANWFIRDSRKNQDLTPLTPDEAQNNARVLLQRMMITGGIIEGDEILRKAVSNPFYRRTITLTPDDLRDTPELEQYLVSDLVGLTSKYFDKTSRKKILTENFGVGGHAYQDYLNVGVRGFDGAVTTLSTPKSIVAHRTGRYHVNVEVEEQLIPAAKTKELAAQILTEVESILGSSPAQRRRNKNAAIIYLRNAIEGGANDPHYARRVDAIVNGMIDFESNTGLGRISSSEEQFMNHTIDLMNRRPIDGADGTSKAHKYSRSLRAFNSVTLLPFTMLTSIPDVALPLIRSGNFRAWQKAWGKYMSDPEYRRSARRIGTAVENMMHDRMVHMAGDGNQRFSNSFFNFTLLTPWTNMNREVASLVGFEAFRAEQQNAIRAISAGKKNSQRYQRAVRFLSRYGLTGPNAKIDYLAPNAPRLDDAKVFAENKEIQYALHRFVNESIFTPNPNDIPMFANTPWGALVWQLKSFPMMMARMSKYVVKEAFRTDGNNIAPLMYMLSVGVGFGVGANAIKDIVMLRGGDGENEAKLRKRTLTNIAEKMGYDIRVDEGVDEFFGTYAEGLLAMGGLGLFVEMLYNAAEQLDNGSYGKLRILSALFGPTVGKGLQAADILAGARPGASTGEERAAVRAATGNIPFVGSIKAVRESMADLAGEPRSKAKSRTRYGSAFGKKGLGKRGFN